MPDGGGMTITHNRDLQRFEADVDGHIALLDYRRSGDRIVLVHTEVPFGFEGGGIGGALAQAALEYAREEALKVVPRCSFTAAYIRRHPEYAALLAPGAAI